MAGARPVPDGQVVQELQEEARRERWLSGDRAGRRGGGATRAQGSHAVAVPDAERYARSRRGARHRGPAARSDGRRRLVAHRRRAARRPAPGRRGAANRVRRAGTARLPRSEPGGVRALGDEDAPSDLLLRLDARVQHLLVDEFQDTSLVQLELLRRLTAGWQPDDGRTLFAVGDPMQSIYRFREAEVRFFLDAERSRMIGEVPVDVLRLRRNFRSQRRLVDWSNDMFAPVLGGTSDRVRGTVAFEPAVATRDPIEMSGRPSIFARHRVPKPASVVARIRAAQAAGAHSIAVLVRARTHLLEILPALGAKQIAFAAVELDRLAERQVVIDLVALTHALMQPADRAAWLAVLRAPWCGLSLAGPVCGGRCRGSDRRAAIAARDSRRRRDRGLSPEGRDRLSHVADVLRRNDCGTRPRGACRSRARRMARARRAGGARRPARSRRGERCTSSFCVAHEVGGDLAGLAPRFADALELAACYAGADAAGVQVMTMHKAKGLRVRHGDSSRPRHGCQAGRPSPAALATARRAAC